MSDRIDLPLWVYFSLVSINDRPQAVRYFFTLLLLFPFSVVVSWGLQSWFCMMCCLFLCVMFGAAIRWVDENSFWEKNPSESSYYPSESKEYT